MDTALKWLPDAWSVLAAPYHDTPEHGIAKSRTGAAAAGRSQPPFAGLLRRLRIAAGMTQEQLAAAATVSARSISDLERGVNQTPRRDTARLLADALRLTGAARAEFMLTAQRRPVFGHFDRVDPGVIGRLVGAPGMPPNDLAWIGGCECELHQVIRAAVQAVASGTPVGIYPLGPTTGIAVHVACLILCPSPVGCDAGHGEVASLAR